MIPRSITHSLALYGPLSDLRAIGGGDSSEACFLLLDSVPYLLKWRPESPPGYWSAEVDGLARLRTVAVLPVPSVLAFDDSEVYGWIALQWFESVRPFSPAALAQGLAALHAHSAPVFGLDRANFIGRLPQSNTQSLDWPTFWSEQRLQPQFLLARAAGLMHTQRELWAARLLNHLPAILDHQPRPSLLHGDLWAGNVITAPDGRPALIDPALSYGDRETDLAFAALFGGFDPQFFKAYQAVAPLPDGWQARQQVYQLYWLLVHLNMFGESYGAAVDRVLQYYAG